MMQGVCRVEQPGVKGVANGFASISNKRVITDAPVRCRASVIDEEVGVLKARNDCQIIISDFVIFNFIIIQSASISIFAECGLLTPDASNLKFYKSQRERRRIETTRGPKNTLWLIHMGT
jgi:hypothetical protein